MTRRTGGQLAVLVGAVLIAAADLTLAWRYSEVAPGLYWSEQVIALTWVAMGVLATRVRPGSRTGWLMAALGLVLLLDAPLVYQLTSPPTPLALAQAATLAGMAVWHFQFVLGAHAILTYPSGRLARRSDRVFFRVAYGWGVAATLISLATRTPVPRLCDDHCLPNPVHLFGDADTYVAVRQAVMLALTGLTLVFVVLLVRRVRRASPRERRVLAVPLLAAGATTGLLLVALLISQVDTESRGATFALFASEYLGLIALPVGFLLGLLQQRLGEASVAELVRDLRDVRADQVQGALARALRDPGLLVAFPVTDPAEGTAYVGPDGRPVDPSAFGDRHVTTVGPSAEPLAVLVHDPWLSSDPRLLDAAGAAARLALENGRLQAEVRSQLAEVRDSRARIVAATDSERRRLERDLHDGAQQRLLGVGLALQMLRSELGTTRTPAHDLLDEAGDELKVALGELRDFARGVHPAVLTDRGLLAAVADLARRVPVPVVVTTDPASGEEPSAPRRWPAPVEATAYFVVSEALQNVVKHARASRATVSICSTGAGLTVAVTDDGVGGVTSARSGSGLRGLTDRVAAVGGTLRVDSTPGLGTTVTVEVPCGS